MEGRGSDQSQRAAELRHRYWPYHLMVCHRLSVPGAAWDTHGELQRDAVAREPVLQALHRQLREHAVLFLGHDHLLPEAEKAEASESRDDPRCAAHGR